MWCDTCHPRVCMECMNLNFSNIMHMCSYDMGVEGSNLSPSNMLHASTHGRLGQWRKTRICSLLHRSFHPFFPCRATHVIYRFDGKLEPGFFQHILVGRVEHQPFHDGMDNLEPFQHQAYMFTRYGCGKVESQPPNIMHVSTHGRFGKWRQTRICSLPHIPFPLSCINPSTMEWMNLTPSNIMHICLHDMGVEGTSLNPSNIMHASTHG